MRLYIRNKEKYDPSKAGKALVFVEFPDPRVFSVGQVKEVIFVFFSIETAKSEQLFKPYKPPEIRFLVLETKERSRLS